MDKRELEIMAPAGNFECLQAAIQGGANSVYFGIGRLNMRSHSANNFAPEDLPEIVRICRSAGVRTYMTLNIILFGEDIAAARQALMAAILYCRRIGLEVHISTQLSISNYEALKFYAQFADVVVLARELNLQQVKAIHEQIVAEDLRGPSGDLVRIEMFAHGAFCMAVSGKCYLSLDRLGSSANRGACLQVCRRSYAVRDLESGEELVVDNKYIMSPKDLCTIEFMDKFTEAGVKVFKIEGRARSAEYVRRTAACYRRAADAVCDGTYTPELTASLKASLAEVFNRGFWDGYYMGAKLGQWSAIYGSQATRRKVYFGKVTNWFDRIGVAEILVEAHPLHKGDEVMVIGPTTGCVTFRADDIRVDFTSVDEAPKGVRCSVALRADNLTGDSAVPSVDLAGDNAAKLDSALLPDKRVGERVSLQDNFAGNGALRPAVPKLRRGDKVFLWVEDE